MGFREPVFYVIEYFFLNQGIVTWKKKSFACTPLRANSAAHATDRSLPKFVLKR